jgi:hypothetical protein
MENNVSQEDMIKIKESLHDSKSLNRKNAAKKIGKKKIIDLGDDLFCAYLKEKNDIRTWETQTFWRGNFCIKYTTMWLRSWKKKIIIFLRDLRFGKEKTITIRMRLYIF